MNEVSVIAQGTTISISDETTKTFEKYTKTVIHFHRWGSSPPQFIYLDLHGTVSNLSFLTIGHLIVYGVKETISNVDPSVYDTAFVIENGKMLMETDLSLNGHNLSGYTHYIHGFHDKNGNGDFLLNGSKRIVLNKNNVLKKAKIIYETNQSKYNSISLFLRKENPNDSRMSTAHKFDSTDKEKKRTKVRY